MFIQQSNPEKIKELTLSDDYSPVFKILLKNRKQTQHKNDGT